jgi:hypothetical protein
MFGNPRSTIASAFARRRLRMPVTADVTSAPLRDRAISMLFAAL